ncbi:hypothetical protein [Novosphingobium rosa]|uniref:hypothetical protein n=1 Tax=Novosphingobium rosa TaxID=76978 RepID=UPI000A5BE73F|nr:hypothetical protein [Novosphingobium rosa]
MTPFDGWMLWHHVAGMMGGSFLLAWIFSGWLSVDPWRPVPNVPDRVYAATRVLPPIDFVHLRCVAIDVRRVKVTKYSG